MRLMSAGTHAIAVVDDGVQVELIELSISVPFFDEAACCVSTHVLEGTATPTCAAWEPKTRFYVLYST